MGQLFWSIPQYTNEKCVIIGGYWNWIVKDHKGNELFSGWWNSNDEFDITMAELGIV